MDKIFPNADPISFLTYGAMGIGFFLAILSFYLLWGEQKRQEARLSILVSTLLLTVVSLALTGMGLWNEWDKRHAEQVAFRVIAKFEGTEPDDPIRMEVCAGPWPLDVEGRNVNREVHANLDDFRVKITAPGYSEETLTVSRIRPSQQDSDQFFVDNDGVARLGTYPLHKTHSPPPPKDFTKTSGVRP